MLSEDRELAEFFEAALAGHADARAVCNWTLRDVLGLVGEHGSLAGLALTPRHLGDVLEAVGAGRLTAASGREALRVAATSGESIADIVNERGLEAVSDVGELEAVIEGVLSEHPANVEKYRGGESKVFNFFVGQVMRKTQGKANPALVREILTRHLTS